ncbi:GntR family transcriptional regulator [Yinghuangia soli]|uniref:GntR family transcriptional regulator n=1 Tax=Yinghuangia soli TaxID=2908204 RepID=A0AA41Q4P6_9ACTN|nr:GntR family transcriptional regulator [Yinghuangia soli]MCF2531499.1 GntR family transcriptional regulator [Yinghuangia soli]
MVRAADHAYEVLRAGILDGSFGPGERLGESELADATGTSRTPVREALRRLEAEGLVEVAPHRGARVTNWTRADVAEIYDLRLILESFAAERAATRVTDADVTRLRELSAAMEAAAAPGEDRDLELLARLNTEFHMLIRTAADSPRLLTMLGAVVQMPLVLTTFHRYAESELARSAAHHRDLVDALEARDARWAQSAMRAHVAAAKSSLLRSLPPTPDDV